MNRILFSYKPLEPCMVSFAKHYCHVWYGEPNVLNVVHTKINQFLPTFSQGF